MVLFSFLCFFCCFSSCYLSKFSSPSFSSLFHLPSLGSLRQQSGYTRENRFVRTTFAYGIITNPAAPSQFMFCRPRKHEAIPCDLRQSAHYWTARRSFVLLHNRERGSWSDPRSRHIWGPYLHYCRSRCRRPRGRRHRRGGGVRVTKVRRFLQNCSLCSFLPCTLLISPTSAPPPPPPPLPPPTPHWTLYTSFLHSAWVMNQARKWDEVDSKYHKIAIFVNLPNIYLSIFPPPPFPPPSLRCLFSFWVLLLFFVYRNKGSHGFSCLFSRSLRHSFPILLSNISCDCVRSQYLSYLLELLTCCCFPCFDQQKTTLRRCACGTARVTAARPAGERPCAAGRWVETHHANNQGLAFRAPFSLLHDKWILLRSDACFDEANVSGREQTRDESGRKCSNLLRLGLSGFGVQEETAFLFYYSVFSFQ